MAELFYLNLSIFSLFYIVRIHNSFQNTQNMAYISWQLSHGVLLCIIFFSNCNAILNYEKIYASNLEYLIIYIYTYSKQKSLSCGVSLSLCFFFSYFHSTRVFLWLCEYSLILLIFLCQCKNATKKFTIYEYDFSSSLLRTRCSLEQISAIKLCKCMCETFQNKIYKQQQHHHQQNILFKKKSGTSRRKHGRLWLFITSNREYLLKSEKKEQIE